MSQNDTGAFVNTKIWNLFCARFKSETTKASYESDMREFCTFTGRKFAEIDSSDVREYYNFMRKRMEEGRIGPLTVTKKFRELHSFSEFCLGLPEGGETAGDIVKEDYFYPWLKTLAKEKNLARSVPVEDMDRILKAAAGDRMAYTILTLMYRAGLSSTEIISLNGEDDFALYDDGAYVYLESRREPCYIPGDAWEILSDYMSLREPHGSLFYNRSGRRLNGMYISRMMKKYCTLAGTPGYSAEAVRNCCAFNLFAYGASAEEVAGQMGRTQQQIRRYRGTAYRGNLRKHAGDLVKVSIEKP